MEVKAMKKLLSILLCMVLILGVLSVSASAEKSITLKFCCSESADTSYVIIMQKAFDKITEETNGAVKFEVFASNTLGTIADTLEQMQSGAPLIVSSGFSEIADIASKTFLVTALPYVFQDMSEILVLAHTDWIKGIEDEIAQSNIKALCYGTQGYRHFISTKPIYDASSIKGMIVRMGPSATSQNFITVMGGTPTTSTWADNYSLLQTGVIDACEASLELMYNSSLYEVCDYLTLSGHLASPFMCTMNMDIWDQISPENQEIILSNLDAATYELYDACVENENNFVSKYEETGITVLETDKSTFAAYVPALIEYMGYSVDDYNALREVIEAAK